MTNKKYGSEKEDIKGIHKVLMEHEDNIAQAGENFDEILPKNIDISIDVSKNKDDVVDISQEENIDKIISPIEEINSVNEKMDSLISMFEHKIAYDKTKQEQIDSLHAELQKYKSDLIAKTSWPIINGLIQMYSFNNKRIIKIDKKQDNYFSRKNFKKEIQSFQEDIEILLEQNGVLAFRDSEVTDEFLSQRQRALKTTKINDKSLQGKIVNSIRAGFEQGEKTLQKEFVNVYVYQAEELDRIDSSTDLSNAKITERDENVR